MLWRGTRFILFRGKDSIHVVKGRESGRELKCKKPRTAGRKGGLAAKMATALQARGKNRTCPGKFQRNQSK